MLIDKEDAIKAVCEACYMFKYVGEHYKECKYHPCDDIKALEAVPEAPSGDCISRVDAIEALGEEPEIILDTDAEWEMHDRWVDAMHTMKAPPSAEAEPKTGEWICKGDYAVCSECGGSSGTQFDGVERIPRTTTFCPNCGAIMRRAESEVEE